MERRGRKFTREFEQEVQAAFPPYWLQRLSLAPLAWLARRRSHDARYTAPPPTTIGDVELADGGVVR